MLVIIGGIIVMALGSGTGSSTAALLFGLATMVLFGVTNFLLKYAGHHGSDSVTTTAVLWLSAGVCGVAGHRLLPDQLRAPARHAAACR